MLDDHALAEVRSLCANRVGKDRNRRRLARREVTGRWSTGAADALDLQREVIFVAQILGEADFALLVEAVETLRRRRFDARLGGNS
jgi:hypothetical protein